MSPSRRNASASLRAMATAGLLALTAGIASADNPLNNLVDVTVTGEDNRLYIQQDHAPSGAGTVGANRIHATIEGFGNGGFEGLWHNGRQRLGGLEPGRLIQSGSGNSIALAVIGEANLFSFSQRGHDNRIEARMTGTANMMAVAQVGHGNHAALSQNGARNMIVVSQTSY